MNPSPALNPTATAPEQPPAEALIGGTLALLTFYARTPNLAAADSIARNLALMARHPAVPEGLQSVCTRLFTDWLGPLDCQDVPAERQWRTVMAAPETTQ